jgi:hypothetical protein
VKITQFWNPRKETHPPSDPDSGLPLSLRTALSDLERLIESRPELADPGQQLASILKATFSVPCSPTPDLTSEETDREVLIELIRDGWSNEVPALRKISITFDRSLLLQRATAITDCGAGDLAVARRLHELIVREPDRVARWIDVLLDESDEALTPVLAEEGIDPSYALSVLRLLLLGELGDWSAMITAHLQETSWPRPDCPICGSMAALAESRGLEQRRVLRCDRCGAGWPTSRLQCPFCGETKHQVLRYLFVEGEQERYRLALCDRCGGRLKVIATHAQLSCPGLLVAQLAMIHLDFIEDTDDVTVKGTSGPQAETP